MNVAIVVAHPDDEAIAFFGILLRYLRALVVHTTDGAPMDSSEWKGHASREAYAEVRRRELARALFLVKHDANTRRMLGITDMTATWHIPLMTQRLVELFTEQGTSVVYTHAYEGGHPDHDATACAVHMAVRRLKRRCRIIEAPIHRMSPQGEVWQQFIPGVGDQPMVVPLTEAEQELKRRMLAAHASQGDALSAFRLDVEPYRDAPEHDFLKPANGGLLSGTYARADIDAHVWRSLVLAAQQ